MKPDQETLANGSYELVYHQRRAIVTLCDGGYSVGWLLDGNWLGLRDEVPEERELGIRAGFVWGALATKRVFYVDLGWSSGMRAGLAEARRIGQPVEVRYLPGWTG